VSWPALKEALARDGRLQIRESGDSWEIDRSASDRSLDDRALTRYKAAVASQIYGHYAPAAKKIREIESMKEPARQHEIDRITGRQTWAGVEGLVATYVYLFCESHDIPFSQITVPAALTDPKLPPQFAQLKVTSYYDSLALHTPTGATDTFRSFVPPGSSDADLEKTLREMQFAAKLVIDPVTLVCAFRPVTYFKSETGTMAGAAPPVMIAPARMKISMRPDMVWDKGTIDGLNTRAAASDQTLPKASKEVTVDASLPRMSALLLKAAQGTEANLVYYVSPFTDYQLKAKALTSISRVVSDANGTGIDSSWLDAVGSERVLPGLDWKLGPALPAARRMTLSESQGVYVVRNELRFLDRWCSGPPATPTSYDNRLLAGKAPKLDELVSHVSALPVAQWPTSIFSSNYLSYCNPLSFRPFAKALRTSPMLRRAVALTTPLEPQSVPFRSLEINAQAALANAITECGPLNDACIIYGADPDPIVAWLRLKEANHENVNIKITQSASGYSFSLVDDKRPIWLSWVKNVDGRE
jgi:hypothetical protein